MNAPEPDPVPDEETDDPEAPSGDSCAARPYLGGARRKGLVGLGGPRRRVFAYIALDVEREAARKAATRAHSPAERQALDEHAQAIDRLLSQALAVLTNAARARGDLDVSAFERPGR